MAKTKTIHIKARDLWPEGGSGSTIYCGGTTVQFQSGRKGRRVAVTSKRHKPRHKAQASRARKDS